MNCASELLDKQAQSFGDRPVLHQPGTTWRYSDLLARANRIAHVLVDDLGIRPGNRVLMRAPNNLMYVACWFAVMKVGAVAVATMPLLRARELHYMADTADISLALCDRRLTEELEIALGRSDCLERVLYFNGDDDDGLEALMAGKPADFANVETAANDVCLIAFTSGTTGPPKGCMHMHRDILAICDTFSRYVLQPEPQDVFAGSPPIAFTFGLGALVTFPMHAGASSLLMESYTPESMLAAIDDYGVSVLFTAPTMYRALTAAARDAALPSLKKCVSGGETLPKPTFDGWQEATGIRIIDGLGATEMLHIFVTSAGDGIRPAPPASPYPDTKRQCWTTTATKSDWGLSADWRCGGPRDVAT